MRMRVSSETSFGLPRFLLQNCGDFHLIQIGHNLCSSPADVNIIVADVDCAPGSQASFACLLAVFPRQLSLDVQVADQPMKIIRMKSEQLGGLGVISLG